MGSWWFGLLQDEVGDKEKRLEAAYAKVASLEQLDQLREFNITGQLPLQTAEAILERGPFTPEQIASMVHGPLLLSPGCQNTNPVHPGAARRRLVMQTSAALKVPPAIGLAGLAFRTAAGCTAVMLSNVHLACSSLTADVDLFVLPTSKQLCPAKKSNAIHCCIGKVAHVIC